MLSEIVFLTKSLASEYAASWAKQTLSHSFLNKYYKFPISLNFRILLRCLGKGPQALSVSKSWLF